MFRLTALASREEELAVWEIPRLRNAVNQACGEVIVYTGQTQIAAGRTGKRAVTRRHASSAKP
jgi:dephospho-CoA kinase